MEVMIEVQVEGLVHGSERELIKAAVGASSPPSQLQHHDGGTLDGRSLRRRRSMRRRVAHRARRSPGD